MSTYSYVMKGVSKALPGGRLLFKDIWLSFFPGAKIGIVGVNGAGKSTLLKIMAGEDKEFTGESWAREGLKVGYLSQEPALDPTMTVQEAIFSGLTGLGELLAAFETVNSCLMNPLSDDELQYFLDQQSHLQEKIDALDGWDADHRVATMHAALGCPPLDRLIATLSGGEKRRVALCRLLIQQPDMLLLDEPTNHLDTQAIASLEKFLQDYKGTVVLITHDRYFLDNVVGWILEIDRGQGFPFEGHYSQWLEAKKKRLEEDAQVDESRKKVLAQELAWMRQAPKARMGKNKARIASYETLLAESQRETASPTQIVIPAGPRLGQIVIEATALKKQFSENHILFDNLTFQIPPGAIVGVIGSNGRGKSTLFRLITGYDQPDSGKLKLGETVVLGYVDQSRDTLDSSKTVWQEISDGQEEIMLGKRSLHSRAYCALFQFKGSDQQKPVASLSGGERNRVHLAKTLKSGANVLLLDEPTNDLDLDTLRALETALLSFAGCVLVISHDRWFLDRLATHILAFEGNGQVVWFEGNYQEYERDLKTHRPHLLSTPKIRKIF